MLSGNNVSILTVLCKGLKLRADFPASRARVNAMLQSRERKGELLASLSVFEPLREARELRFKILVSDQYQ